MGWPSSSASRWEITLFFKYFFTCDPGNPIGPSWLWLARTLRARSSAWNPHSRSGHLHLEGAKQASKLWSSSTFDKLRHSLCGSWSLRVWHFPAHLAPSRQAVTVSLNNVDDRSCFSTLRLLYSPTLLLLLLAAMARWPTDHVWVFVNGQEVLESVLVTRWTVFSFLLTAKKFCQVFL